MSARHPLSCPARNCRSRSDGASPAWMSSTMTTTGSWSAMQRRKAAVASNSSNRARSGSVGCGGGSPRAPASPARGAPAERRRHRGFRRTFGAHVRADDLHPRPEGGRASAVPTATREHARLVPANMLRDLLGESSLANAGLASKQHDGALAAQRRVERIDDRPELASATEQGIRSDDRRLHAQRRRVAVELGVLAQDRGL